MSRRLFFSLPVPPALQSQIVNWREQQFSVSNGRPVPAENLHLTLAFLGEVSEEKLPRLCRAASCISAHPFVFTLNNIGHWHKSGIVWLGSHHCPDALTQLAEQLRSLSLRSGCPPAENYTYTPHVSLLRKVSHSIALPTTIPGWKLHSNSFTLCQSQFDQQGTHYRVLQSWPFRMHHV